MFIAILCIIFIIFADQLTKWLCVALLEGTQSVYLIPDVLRLTYVENRGAAFGMLDEHRWVFLVLSTVAIIGLFIFLAKKPPESRLAWAGFTLVIGGGVGNMIDRFFYTGIQGDTIGEKVVRDFIDVRMFGELWPWVFNVADSCVCVGGAMLFLWCVVSIFKEAKAEKLAKAVNVATTVKSEPTYESAEGEKDNAEKEKSTDTEAAEETPKE
jgi:signal peptidase II